MAVLTPSLTLKRSTVLQKRRELPVDGSLLVKVGQRVTRNLEVAEAFLQGELVILRLAEKMSLEVNEVIAGLRVQEHQKIGEGDLLCEHEGLWGLLRQRFVSPVAGEIEFISASNGHIGVRMAPHKVTLDAYIDGVVTSLEPRKAVIIESEVAFIQGIFGIGGERYGTLRLLDVANGTVLEAEHIPANCTGLILVGGTSPSGELLRLAASRGAVGLVTGAIGDTALNGYLGFELGVAITGDEPVSMTLLVTEGFGKLPLSDRVTSILIPLDGKRASLNGATQVRAGAVRPELLVSLEGTTATVPKEIDEQPSLEVGVRTRIVRAPWLGQLGTIADLPSQLADLPTGARSRVARVTLENGEVVTVARANLELL